MEALKKNTRISSSTGPSTVQLSECKGVQPTGTVISRVVLDCNSVLGSSSFRYRGLARHQAALGFSRSAAQDAHLGAASTDSFFSV